MDDNSDYQLLLIQATIESSRRASDDKMKKLTEDLTEMITTMMYQIKISKSSSGKKDSPKAQDPTTLVLANKRDYQIYRRISFQPSVGTRTY